MNKLENDELAADAAVAKKKKPKITLEALMNKAREMEALAQRHAAKLDEAKTIKEQYDKMAFEDLPEAMQMMGLKTLGLASGAELNLQEIISCRIKPESQEEAHAWLRANEHGDLIKNEVTVVFGKDEDGEAKKLMEMIGGAKIEYGSLTREEKVHPQTLKAFVSEQIRRPEEFPCELFGVNIINMAHLNQPKKRSIK